MADEAIYQERSRPETCGSGGWQAHGPSARLAQDLLTLCNCGGPCALPPLPSPAHGNGEAQ
jgi:hypothetical protein